jgi:hypothetical protein
MKRNLLWTGAALLLSAAGTVAAADDLPKAETILDKYVEVTGGKAAYAKVHNEISTGTMTLGAMGITGKVTAYQAEPNKQVVEVEIEGIGKVREGTDGEVAWGLNPMQGPRIKEGEERDKSIEAARISAEAQWRDLYKSAETAGVETVDGKDCYKVVLTPKTGSPVTKWFDKESNLLVKSSTTLKTAMGDIQSESTMSDYRKEGDILLPHKTVSHAMGQEITITIDTVKYNAEIPKDKFDLPAEIQALVKKK